MISEVTQGAQTLGPGATPFLILRTDLSSSTETSPSSMPPEVFTIEYLLVLVGNRVSNTDLRKPSLKASLTGGPFPKFFRYHFIRFTPRIDPYGLHKLGPRSFLRIQDQIFKSDPGVP